jgi:hypothetical protein
VAIVLAVVQAADLAYTTLSPAYGDEHLDHLGVPSAVRPLLPVVKAGAVVALAATARRPRARSVVGGALVAYYAAAVRFHRSAGDSVATALPAAVLGCMAATLVGSRR